MLQKTEELVRITGRQCLCFPAPRPITSEAQNEHPTELLYSLERRGHLSASEEKYAELLTVLIEAYEEEHFPSVRSRPWKCWRN